MYKLITFVLCVLTSTAHGMPIAYFDFDNDGLQDNSLVVDQGSSFTADIYISGIDMSHGGLLSWGTQLDFDNALLTADSFTINPAWPLVGVGNSIDNAGGKVELLASALFGSDGTLALYDVMFTAQNAGNGLLTLQQLFPGNATFTGFAGADSHDYDGEILFQSADITVTAVPLPPALLLFITGMIAVFARTRRRQY